MRGGNFDFLKSEFVVEFLCVVENEFRNGGYALGGLYSCRVVGGKFVLIGAAPRAVDCVLHCALYAVLRLVVLFADNSANVLNGLLHYNANGVYKVSVAYAFGAYAHVVKLVRNSSAALSPQSFTMV